MLCLLQGWGEQGYFKLRDGVGGMGMCNIASTASYPIKEHDNPAVPEVCDIFGWQECPTHNKCMCSFSLFWGWICLRCGPGPLGTRAGNSAGGDGVGFVVLVKVLLYKAMLHWCMLLPSNNMCSYPSVLRSNVLVV